MDRVLEPEVMDTEEDAREYDRMDHTEANEAFVRRVTNLGAHGLMLDMGTGPGHIPLLLLEGLTDAKIVGIDLSRKMLEIAEEHRAESRHADRVDYRLADAKDLPFEDGNFDTVYSNTILHHIPNPVPFLAEARRVLRPRGVLLIRDLFRPASAARVEELVREYASEATPYQRELFGASLHAALTPEELREMADSAGLEAAEIVIDSDRHMSLQIASALA